MVARLWRSDGKRVAKLKGVAPPIVDEAVWDEYWRNSRSAKTERVIVSNSASIVTSNPNAFVHSLRTLIVPGRRGADGANAAIANRARVAPRPPATTTG